MPILNSILFATILCVCTLCGHGQTAPLKSIRIGQLSLKYPSDWWVEKQSQGDQARLTLSPDSMKNLAMRIIIIYEYPSRQVIPMKILKMISGRPSTLYQMK